MLARIFLNGIATFARIADSVALTDNAIGLAAIETLRDDPNATVWLVAFILAVKSSSTLDENLQALTAALADSVLPIERPARELAALPAEVLGRNTYPTWRRFRFIKQVAVTQLIGKYRDEKPDTPIE